MPLGRARWVAASPYLDRALDLAPAERTAWIASLRAENPALAADVEALLERHARVNDARFLEDEGLFQDVLDAPDGLREGSSADSSRRRDCIGCADWPSGMPR